MGSRIDSASRISRRLKPRGLFNARRGDQGFSLIELMIAIVIFSIISSIVTVAMVNGDKASSTTTSSVMTQNDLVTALTQIGRDISASSAVLPPATPDGLIVMGLQGGHCVVSTFSATGTTLTEARKTITPDVTDSSGNVICPLLGNGGGSTSTQPIVTGLTSTQIFSYFNSDNNDITTDIADPTNNANESNIARISYTVSAQVTGRNNPMVLTSSSTLLETGSHHYPQGGAFNCPAPVLSGNLDPSDPTTADMTWTQPVTADGYVLTNNGTPDDQVSDPTLTSFADQGNDASGLAPGSSFLYYVYATCGTDTSPQSNGIVINTPPAAPPLTGKLVALDSDAIVNDGQLTWQSAQGASTYQLYRTAPNGTTYTQVYNGAGTTYTDKDLTANDTYRYYVTATGIGGTSSNSNVVRLTPNINAPAAPLLSGSLYANDSDGYKNDGKLTWTSVTGADTYDLYVQPAGSTGWTNIYEGANTAFNYINKMSFGKTYAFKVTASGPGGQSPDSNIVKLTPALVASLPLNLAGHVPNLSQTCKLSWSWGIKPAPTFPATNKYNVYMSTSGPGSGYSLITSMSNTANSFDKTNCPWGRTVWFKVTTNVQQGPRIDSNVVKLLIGPGPFRIKTIHLSPQGVGAQLTTNSTEVTYSNTSNGTMSAWWTKSAGATKYIWDMDGTQMGNGSGYSWKKSVSRYTSTAQAIEQGGTIHGFRATAVAANGLQRDSNLMHAQSNPTTVNRLGMIQQCVVGHNDASLGTVTWGERFYIDLEAWNIASNPNWKDATVWYHVTAQGYGKDGSPVPSSKYVSDPSGDGWIGADAAFRRVTSTVNKGDKSKWVITVQTKANRLNTGLSNETSYSPVVTFTMYSQLTDNWAMNSGVANNCGNAGYAYDSLHNADYNQRNYPATWGNGFTRASHDSWYTGSRTPDNAWTNTLSEG